VIGEQELRTAAETALRFAGGEGRQAEVTVRSVDGSLTRYANSEIHQHVAERNATVRVRIAIGKRIGSATANGLDAESLRQVVERATTIARLQRENPDFPGLPGPFKTTWDGHAGFSERTAAATPESRADLAGIVCRRATDAGLIAAGVCATNTVETALANSVGTFGYFAGTQAHLQAVIYGETSSGYGERMGADLSTLDAGEVAEEAAGKAERGKNPIDLEPGEYDVVLEPYAVEDITGFVVNLGLQGRAVLEQTSFATGKLGEKLLNEQVTLRDDPLDPTGFIRPFDAEGVPKRPLTLVERGVVKAVTFDSLTAAKAGTETTGHATPGSSMYGPVAGNVFLETGEASRDELIGKIDRGLLVTRFHYTRPVHPLTVTVTGMTRDATFLIERGEVTRPVKNLRFTQSYVQALQRVIGVGSNTLLLGSYGSAARAPALAIRAFTFTGKSEY
jgi:predicted Zn-dependent protease